MSEVFTQTELRRKKNNKERRAYHRKKRIRLAMVLFFTCVLVVAATVVAVPYVKQVLNAQNVADFPGPGTGEVLIEIPEGSTGTTMGEILAEANVVASSRAFIDAFKSDPRSASIQPGSYKLKLKMSGQGAVSALLDPASKAELKITIPEGFAQAQIVERVANIMNVPTSDVEAVLKDPAQIGLPAEANGHPEGWLAPATYTVAPKATVKDILSDMVANRVKGLEKQRSPAIGGNVRSSWPRSLNVKLTGLITMAKLLASSKTVWSIQAKSTANSRWIPPQCMVLESLVGSQLKPN